MAEMTFKPAMRFTIDFPQVAARQSVEVLNEFLTRVAIASLKGEDGREASFRRTETAIQWRLGDGAWTDLVLLADIKGEPGSPAPAQFFTGIQQPAVPGPYLWAKQDEAGNFQTLIFEDGTGQ